MGVALAQSFHSLIFSFLLPSPYHCAHTEKHKVLKCIESCIITNTHAITTQVKKLDPVSTQKPPYLLRITTPKDNLVLNGNCFLAFLYCFTMLHP